MSTTTVYNELRYKPSQIPQIRGFTAQAMKGMYQGEARSRALALGYDVEAMDLTDDEVLTRIDTHASSLAESIVSTVNDMLRARLMAQSASATDADLYKAATQFFAEARSYNNDYLLPRTERFARQWARDDLYQKNDISTTWICVGSRDDPDANPGVTDSDDECAEAINGSPLSADDAASYDFPAHYGCPHSLIPTDDVEDQPDALSWYGDDLSEPIEQKSLASRIQALALAVTEWGG